jgi:hypothetical protein
MMGQQRSTYTTYKPLTKPSALCFGFELPNFLRKVKATKGNFASAENSGSLRHFTWCWVCISCNSWTFIPLLFIYFFTLLLVGWRELRVMFTHVRWVAE